MNLKSFWEQLKLKLPFKKNQQDLDDDLASDVAESLSDDPVAPVTSKFSFDMTKLQKFLNSLKQIDLKSFDIEGALHRFYAPANRAVIHKGFIIAFLSTASYGGGKLVGDLASFFLSQNEHKKSTLRPATPFLTQDYRDDMKSIEDTNLFNTGSGEKKQKINRANQLCFESNISSSLPIKLVNTIVLQDTVKSIAAVQLRGANSVEDFREKDKISDLAIIGKIDEQKIYVRNQENGECEYLSVGGATALRKSGIQVHSVEDGAKLLSAQNAKEGIKTDGNRFTIKNKLRDEILGDLGSVLTQAKAIPITNPDGSMSFKITNVVPGSIYSYLNIQDEDIIEGINGKKIQNLNEVMTMFRDIKTVDNLSLTIKREGAEQNFEYGFEK